MVGSTNIETEVALQNHSNRIHIDKLVVNANFNLLCVHVSGFKYAQHGLKDARLESSHSDGNAQT